jgi:hypothetical protein
LEFNFAKVTNTNNMMTLFLKRPLAKLTLVWFKVVSRQQESGRRATPFFTP